MRPHPVEFLQSSYPILRPGKKPFPWMERLFASLCDGSPPLMADLPTGTGKTDIAVIWLLALAFYGLDRKNRAPVPRRMLWVVNRRVLVGQIYSLANELLDVLRKNSESEINVGLRNLSVPGENLDAFKVVQLRGQIIADREWSFNPATPALIIGTVDQIGSRLLFQGYGLGKRERPMQAGLFGVDAWMCVDEAHLVPAFIMAMRQLRHHISRPMPEECPQEMQRLFASLPWYFTELSATPGLPPPPPDFLLKIEEDDRENPVIAQRLEAIAGKSIHLHDCEANEVPARIAKRALELQNQRKRVAIYVFTPAAAGKIAAEISKGICEKIDRPRVLRITGRMRGVERDQLAMNPVFHALSTASRAGGKIDLGQPIETVYLIGTSAAEVGVDTDADVILCDFAPMDTLLQRLGRLDRLGLVTEAGLKAVMEIFGPHPGGISAAAHQLAGKIAGEGYEPSAALLVANAWRDVDVPETNLRATRAVLENSSSPSLWRNHALAPATVQPLFCQPLTLALLDFWTATTPRPHSNLPVQPWLYGFSDNDQGTPLVGVIFRYELDSLIGKSHVEDPETEEPSDFGKQAKIVEDIFERFPPAKTEAHWVPLSLARQWLEGVLEITKTVKAAQPELIALKTEEGWLVQAIPDGVRASSSLLQAESILVLPTSRPVPGPIAGELTNNDLEKDTADVADIAWGTDGSNTSPWRRISRNAPPPDPLFYGKPLKLMVNIFRPDGNPTELFLTYLSRLGAGTSGEKMLLADHQESAKKYAESTVQALVWRTSLLGEFFGTLGLVHDAGKAAEIWQHAIGNYKDQPLAKSGGNQVHPARFQGYRHEWGSLNDETVQGVRGTLLEKVVEPERTIFGDLFDHLIVTHHGYLRPDLPDQPFYQPSALRTEILTASLRWRRLQRILGPWRLAYLEAILKAADTLASRTPEDTTPDEEK